MQKLRIGVHYEPSNVDPHIGSAELALQMTNGVFDTLVTKTVEGDYLAGLAASFEISEDQCVYTLHLRDDVVFHDGTPFTAEAVKFSLDRARNPQNRSQLAGGLLGSYRECRVVDSYCVEIILDRPYALLLDALSQGWLAPMSPTAVTRFGTGIARHPVGTGPFIFDHWEAGERLVIRRNPAYAWGPPTAANVGTAQLDEISFVFLPDPAERTKALHDGTVDAIFATSPADCAAIRADGRFEVTNWPIRGVPVSLLMNIKRTPTDDILVRKAISHALDVDGLVDEVFRGEFTRAHAPVSQFTLGYNRDLEGLYPHDKDKAAALLDAAGWALGADGRRYRGGVPLTVSFYALPVNFYPEFGEIIARQLAAFGITVTVELCAPPAWIRAGMNGDHNLIPQGKYASSSQFLGFVYHSRQSGTDGHGWSKRGPADYPEIDRLLDATETLIDKNDYVPVFRDVQAEVMKAALAVPLHCNANIVAARKGLKGLSFDATGAYPLFHDTSFAPEEV